MTRTGAFSRRSALALALLAVLWLPSRGAQAQIGSDRYASIVLDARSSTVLSASSPDALRFPASLTKMMTLYLLFEAMRDHGLSPATRIPVSANAAAQPPSRLGLRAGSSIAVRDAILALVTRSANDVAVAVGEFLGGGSEAFFAREMTGRARALGMGSTVFRNASGLPDSWQVTTARDMAILGLALIRDFPGRYAAFSTARFTWQGKAVVGHNRVNARYPGADGIKTGYINASGFNIVTSAQRDGTRLVAVVFGGSSGEERDEHVMALLDDGFARSVPRSDMMVAGLGLPRLVGSAMAAPVLPLPSRGLPGRPAAFPVPSRVAPLPEVMADVPAAMRAAPPRRGAAQPAAAALPTPAAWAVQVGAFAAPAVAQRAAAEALRRGNWRGARTEVERVQVGGRTFFRARVTGLTRAAAQAGCARPRGPSPCMVVPPTERG
ncbi:D-alanyl-D-alanine carboxypeptidase family protein [Roseomonas sp. BN140053]|uniref:D-alanyl-D-alanine carboxypeptidase family protein n=1 Tax=Roseomonas sp. BN140053 TaxID=3391898 RepID=UPI0039E91558